MVNTVGGLIDRLSILSRKIVSGSQQGKPVGHFIQEQQQVLAAINTRPDKVRLERIVELAAVNAAIWQAEDALRALRRRESELTADDIREGCQTAFAIQALNDQRSRVIRTINEEAGEFSGAEKMSDEWTEVVTLTGTR